MKQLLVLAFAALICQSLCAQRNGSVSGIAVDTLAKHPVANATITVLLKKDSSLVSFGMTDEAGQFSLNKLGKGEYRLLITHVNYHNSSHNFLITEEKKDIQLGQLPMHDRTTVLEEVVVSGEAPPVTLIDDTIQYNANSFKTQPNANVEQLLKKLPGVEVAKDGTVKAQGQNVSKILVDGKEFFGNDPKMATKNLPADAIDKVQVYDKLSDQAQLTGFDDGNSQKTINLKLKKDKKKGMFGKVMAGAGTRDRIEGRFNINSFKGARQVSAIGMGNNTNTEGFSFMDMMNFTGEMNRALSGGNGNATLTIGNDDPSGGMLGNTNTGIRTIWGTGLNYNNIVGTKTDLTSNYFYNHYNPRTESSVQRQYLLPDSSYFYNQSGLTNTINNSHRLNLGIDYVIDSFNSIKITPSLGYQQTKNNIRSIYEQRGNNGRLSNEGLNNSFSDNTAYNFKNDLLYRRKFRRRGRTFSASLQTNFNRADGDVDLQSVNRFLNPFSSLYRVDSINQHVINESGMQSYTSRLVYTEPLFKRSLIELSVGRSGTRSRSGKKTFDYNQGSTKYDRVNDSLTNDFINRYGYTNAGLRLRTQKKKYNHAVGITWQQAELKGKVYTGIKDSTITKRFNNLLPTARVQYYFSRYKNVTLNYRTYTTQPTITQLQPVPDVTNRLNIYEGNPQLKQEYTHSLQLNYTGLNPYKNKNLFAFITAMRTDNKIVNADSVFASGVRKTMPVNTDGVYLVNGNISLGLPARFIKAMFRMGINVNYNKGKQFINGLGNTISTKSVGPRMSLDIDPGDKIDVSLSGTLNYNQTSYTLQPAFNTNYLSHLYEASVNWELPKGWLLNTEFVYTINNQRAAGFNAQVPLLNAFISKQVLRYNRGELKITVNDILNRNLGITRTTNQNYIEDARVNSLKRYALLSFTYSLTKTGLGGSSNRNMIRIR